jgi:hypothetical protein
MTAIRVSRYIEEIDAFVVTPEFSKIAPHPLSTNFLFLQPFAEIDSFKD